MVPPRSFAALQTIPIRGNVRSNVDHHLHLGRAAAEAGARVLVFPELSLTGYELDLAEELAFESEDPRLDALRGFAAEASVTLVAGAPVRLETGLHIGAFILGPDETFDLYTKRRLGAFPPETNPGGSVPPGEPTVFVPGDRDPLVRFDGHAAAVAVCADTNDPAHPDRAAQRGAGAYLASMFFPPADLEREISKLEDYAHKHSLCTVLSNFGGPTGGLPSAGGSSIWSPNGTVLARLEGAGAGIVVATEGRAGWRSVARRVET